jgi:alkylhydroperoxidase family enzyme
MRCAIGRRPPISADATRAVLAYADSMTRDIHVPDEIFENLKAFFDERQIVELTILIGTYNMHARVMSALQIDPEAAPPG